MLQQTQLIFQIRFWKTEDPDNTLKEVIIARNPPEDNRIKRENNRAKREVKKDRATVKSLYPYSDIEIDIVAVNTFFESNGSNVINITTPEGGMYYPCGSIPVYK